MELNFREEKTSFMEQFRESNISDLCYARLDVLSTGAIAYFIDNEEGLFTNEFKETLLNKVIRYVDAVPAHHKGMTEKDANKYIRENADVIIKHLVKEEMLFPDGEVIEIKKKEELQKTAS